jgi:hypothetical protein
MTAAAEAEPDPAHHNTADETADQGADTGHEVDGPGADQAERGELPDQITDSGGPQW